MEHSELCDDCASLSLVAPAWVRVSSLLCVEVLSKISLERVMVMCQNSLELVQTLLPTSVAFNPDLDTAEDCLLAALEVYSKLDNISVVDRVNTTFHTRAAKSDMVEEGA